MLKEINHVKNFFLSAVRNLDFLICTIGILPCQSEYIFGGSKKGSKVREGKFMFIEHLLSLSKFHLLLQLI